VELGHEIQHQAIWQQSHESHLHYKWLKSSYCNDQESPHSSLKTENVANCSQNQAMPAYPRSTGSSFTWKKTNPTNKMRHKMCLDSMEAKNGLFLAFSLEPFVSLSISLFPYKNVIYCFKPRQKPQKIKICFWLYTRIKRSIIIIKKQRSYFKFRYIWGKK
jgi:hypothetical protein